MVGDVLGLMGRAEVRGMDIAIPVMRMRVLGGLKLLDVFFNVFFEFATLELSILGVVNGAADGGRIKYSLPPRSNPTPK